MKKIIIAIYLLSYAWVIKADEGMYPLSEIKRLNLNKAGMRMSVESLYNPNGVSLIDALVRIGGCTGSFVSDQGLIVTNHHCVFGSVAAASSVNNDYITNGFWAANQSMEIPAQGLTVRITASYEDVSERILAEANKKTNALERLEAIKKQIAILVAEEKKRYPDLLCEVSEMFAGKTYVLFRYQTIQDIRLVYVPQRAIGEFGGESDNWVWPRHTGDFSFARAYVGPDGKPAPYSPNNVPFKPKKFLEINQNGVAENDFVFVLGYPGRTFRHYPAAFIQYQQQYLLPYISKTYDWLINYMNNLGNENDTLRIAYASRIKSLANVTKNYKGKLQGLRRTSLLAQKQAEESEIALFINQKPALNAQYQSLIADVNAQYNQMMRYAPRDLWLGQIANAGTIAIAARLSQLRTEALALPKNQQATFLADKLKPIIEGLRNSAPTYHQKMEIDFLTLQTTDALTFNSDNTITAVANWYKPNFNLTGVAFNWHRTFMQSKFVNYLLLANALEKKPTILLGMGKDPIMQFADAVVSQTITSQNERKTIDANLTALLPKWLDVKMMQKPGSFVPDANATLRLTYGNVKGYEPEDATYFHPFTSLKGVLEKNRLGGDYEMPSVIRTLKENNTLGNFIHPQLQDVPVALLYNLDTTGGNSGSPVLDADGRLIGVNFDRAYTATINDFAWNEAYSRSIGVDIRYVLWVTKFVGKADNVLLELGVK